MDRFRPANVWAWWQKKEGWQKWLWLAVALVGVLLAFVWWIFYHLPDEPPKGIPEGSGGLIGGLEKHFDKSMERTEEKDRELSTKIEKEQEEQKKLQADRSKAMEENKNAREEIDRADSVDDVVDGWNKRRRGRKTD